jgi:hypothetical protein
MTQRYAHLAPQTLQDAAEIVAAVVHGDRSTSTPMTQTITIREGRANVFVAVEHANSEVIGIQR